MLNRPTTPIYAMPIRLELPCRTNSDYAEEFHFSAGGNPIVIDSFTFAMDVKPYPDATTPLHSFGMTGPGPGDGFYIVEDTLGVVQLKMRWETLQSMFNAVYPNRYECGEMQLFYDIVITYSDGSREAWIAGPIILNKGITYV